MYICIYVYIYMYTSIYVYTSKQDFLSFRWSIS